MSTGRGQYVLREIDGKREAFTDLSTRIWENPEPGYHEVQAAQWTADMLRDNGFAVEMPAYGIPTAIRASWGSGHPIVGFLGEYDALPRLSQKLSPHKEAVEGQPYGHACGHNILGVGHLAAAVGLKREMEERGLPGTVVFYGCPAEELGSGKALMAKNGAFKELDVAMAYHPGWFTYTFTGGKPGVIAGHVDFHGRSSHSGSSPQNGRSALLAANLLSNALTMIYQQLPPGSLIHSVVADGGYSPGEIPEHARLKFTAKAQKLTDIETLYRRIEKAAEGIGLVTETSATMGRDNGTAPLVQNAVLAKVLHQGLLDAPQEPWTQEELQFARILNESNPTVYQNRLSELGWQGQDRQMFEGVLPIRSFDTPGSTDVGDVSHIVPTIFCKVCCYNLGTNGHTWQATACAGSSIGQKGMIYAAKALALAALSVMENPAIAAEAKEEFDKVMANVDYQPAVPDDFAFPPDPRPAMQAQGAQR